MSKRGRALTVVAALILIIIAGSAVALAIRAHRRAYVDLELEDADLREAMEAIGRRVGHGGIVVDPTVNERVTISLRGIPWRDAVDVLAKMTKCKVEQRGDVLVLTQPPEVTIADGDLRTTLRLMAAYEQVDIILDPGVQGGPVPGTYRCIEDVAAVASLRVVREGAIVRVLPR